MIDSEHPTTISLRIADLDLLLNAQNSGLSITTPECYKSFLTGNERGEDLRLKITIDSPHNKIGWLPLFKRKNGESWELWQDTSGQRVFVPSRYSPPPRQVIIDKTFSSGNVIGEFGKTLETEEAVYPIKDIDMVLYANWLADTGDFILHAAGIDDEGMGYAFVGPSGAGKSTLISQLTTLSPMTVLGEDQVILRYQNGQFIIYGTPWHYNPRHCSPGGIPLKKLFFLDRFFYHGIGTCDTRSGVELILQNALIPYYNQAGVERIMDNLPILLRRVPLYTLGYQIGADILTLIRKA